MKIAFISLMREFPWGGSEELWFNTARLALAQGHSVCTLTQRWAVEPSKIAELRQAGAETAFYEAARYGLAHRAGIRLGLLPWAADAVPVVRADVCLVSNGSTWDFVKHRGLLSKVLGAGMPYALISQHGFESGHVVEESNREYALRFSSEARRFFFVAERNLRAAERQLGSLLAGAEVVSNPVNLQDRGIKPFPASAALLMACVARLDCDFKGQDILLQVLSRGPWAARCFQLRLYGSGPHQAHLQQLIALYGLDEKVRVEGQVADVDHIWATNHVLVLPSLSEGTPLALVEAMLSGRAAVATDVGDSGQYVLDGRTGYLAATASVNCLAASLEELWNNRHNLAQLGAAAFAHAAAITDVAPHETVWKSLQTAIPELTDNRRVSR